MGNTGKRGSSRSTEPWSLAGRIWRKDGCSSSALWSRAQFGAGSGFISPCSTLQSPLHSAVIETESDIYRFRLLKTEPPSPRGKEAPLHHSEPALSVLPALHTKAPCHERSYSPTGAGQYRNPTADCTEQETDLAVQALLLSSQVLRVNLLLISIP